MFPVTLSALPCFLLFHSSSQRFQNWNHRTYEPKGIYQVIFSNPLSHQFLIIICNFYTLCKDHRTWVCTDPSKVMQNLEFHKVKENIYNGQPQKPEINGRSWGIWPIIWAMCGKRSMTNDVSHVWEEEYVQQCEPWMGRGVWPTVWASVGRGISPMWAMYGKKCQRQT